MEEGPFFFLRTLDHSQALLALQSGQPALAEKLWVQHLAQCPEDQLAAANYSRFLFSQQRFDEIYRLLSVFPRLSLNAAQSALMGQTCLSLRLYRLAHAYIEHALTANPSAPPLLLSLSQALIGSGRFSDARALLQKLITDYPGEPEPQINLAITLSELGLLEDAEHLYRQLLLRFPGHPQILTNLYQYALVHGHDDLLDTASEDLLATLPAGFQRNRLLLDQQCRLVDPVQRSELLIRHLIRHPADYTAQLDLIGLFVDSAEYSQASARLQALLQTLPVQLNELRTRALALAATLPRESQQLICDPSAFDPHAQVLSTTLFSSASEELSRFTRWVQAEPSLLWQRPGKPTVSGLQSHEILDRWADQHRDGLVGALDRLIPDYLAEYRDPLDGRTMASIKPLGHWSGWSVVCAESGHQKQHTHPESLVSGVLYLHLPTEGDCVAPGTLDFPVTGSVGSAPSFFSITPTIGSVVFFPSYLPHSTQPFHVRNTVSVSDLKAGSGQAWSGARVCIAFNYR